MARARKKVLDHPAPTEKEIHSASADALMRKAPRKCPGLRVEKRNVHLRRSQRQSIAIRSIRAKSQLGVPITSCSAPAGKQGMPRVASFVSDQVDGALAHLTPRRRLHDVSRATRPRNHRIQKTHGLAFPVGLIQFKRFHLRLPVSIPQRQKRHEQRRITTLSRRRGP